MRLTGKEVAILMESDFYEHEIFYYQYRFPEEGAELRFLTPTLPHIYRPRIQDSVSSARQFRGHGRRNSPVVLGHNRSVGHRVGSASLLRDVTKLAPAVQFMQRAFAEPTSSRASFAMACGCSPRHRISFAGEKVVAHNNLIGDVRNMGAVYTDRNVVVDGDLVTGRSGGHCHLFARKIIDVLSDHAEGLEDANGQRNWQPGASAARGN